MAEDLFSDLLGEFLLDARDRTARAEELLLSLEGDDPETRPEHLQDTKRELHTLKGMAGMMGFKELQALAHEMEDLVAAGEEGTLATRDILAGLDRFRGLLSAVEQKQGTGPQREKAGGCAPGPGQAAPGREAPVQGSVRVPFHSLDSLVELLAEMVIFKNRLADSLARMAREAGHSGVLDEVGASHEALGKTLVLLQDRIMKLRMVPLRSLFGTLARIVHDEKQREGKEVTLEVTGGDTPLDKALLEVASEALGHLVRNAVIHGIESPAGRRSAAKSEAGRLRIAAHPSSSEVEITVEDDGGGVDREALLAKARERGIEVADGGDLHALLFHAGLSSRESTDMSSGRGMGLFAALRAVQSLGGRIAVASEPGRFSRFSLHLPLSVSIMAALLVKADGEEYALPLPSVVETLRFRGGEGHMMNRAGVFAWRNRVVPLLDLGHIFGTARGLRDSGYVILLGAEGRNRGIIADDITGMREIVVKGLDPVLGSHPGIAGSTVVGDGRVLLILDPQALVGMRPFVRDSRCGTPQEPTGAPEPAS